MSEGCSANLGKWWGGSVWRLAVWEADVKVPPSLGNLTSSVLPAGPVKERMAISNCFSQTSGRTQMALCSGILRNY